MEEIKNIYFKHELVLSVLNEFGIMFLTKIALANQAVPYTCLNREEFSFPEIIYISANRFGPRTSVPIYNDIYKRNRIGANGENLFQFIESYADETINSKLIHEKSEGDTVLYNIRGWLTEISPNVKFHYRINKENDTSYSIFNDHRATNVGFGLSYSLSVIASLLIGTLIPNCLVIIENPEAHIHPKGQTEIAKLIALCAQTGTQVIVETHSDHLFDGIRIDKRNKRICRKCPNSLV